MAAGGGAALRAAGEVLYAWSWQALFEKAHVGPGRIIAAAAIFGFLFLSLTRWWGSLSRLVKPLFLPLGQHALYAWTAHIFVIVVLGLGLKALGLDESNPWLNTVLQIAAVALLWHLARRQFLAVTPRTRLLAGQPAGARAADRPGAATASVRRRCNAGGRCLQFGNACR